MSFGIIKNNLYIALNSFENDKSYAKNGWFNFDGKFDSLEYMENIFQQFETTVMAVKNLNTSAAKIIILYSRPVFRIPFVRP